MKRRILRHITPFHGVKGRVLTAGMALIMGLARIGLFSYQSRNTRIAPEFYGVMLLALTVGLFSTAGRWRLRLAGRIIAGLGSGLMVGLGIDVWRGSVTSSLILFVLGYALLSEAVTREY